jgi:hypothetical protein
MTRGVRADILLYRYIRIRLARATYVIRTGRSSPRQGSIFLRTPFIGLVRGGGVYRARDPIVNFLISSDFHNKKFSGPRRRGGGVKWPDRTNPMRGVRKKKRRTQSGLGGGQSVAICRGARDWTRSHRARRCRQAPAVGPPGPPTRTWRRPAISLTDCRRRGASYV